MNRIVIGLLLALMPVLASAQLKIVTTTPDFADLAKQIGVTMDVAGRMSREPGGTQFQIPVLGDVVVPEGVEVGGR